MDPIFISIVDAAQVLGIGRSKTYQLISANELETVKLGRRRLVSVASVRKLAQRLHGDDSYPIPI